MKAGNKMDERKGLNFLSFLVLCGIWFALVIPGIYWGLPNPVGFEVDGAAIPRPHYSGLDMMRAEAYNYPPLQYLLFNLVSPPKERKVKNWEDYVRIATARMKRFRMVTAFMVLGSAVMLYYLGSFFISSFWMRFLVPFLYLSQGMSNYYAHTTNVDQPYMFWWILSLLGIFLYLKGRYREARYGENQKRIIFLGALIFGISMFLSIATKDHSYASYPFLLFILFLTRRWKGSTPKYIGVFLGLILGGILYTIVYKLAGGWEVFLKHFYWITRQGVERFREVEGNIYGRLILTLQSIKDFWLAFNTPLLLLFFLGIGIWIWNMRKEDNEWMKIGLFTFLIPGLSIFLLFLQPIRFSNPRFWFPLLPGICIVSVYGLDYIWRRREKRWVIIFPGFLIIWNFLSGMEVIYILKNDPRVIARKEVNKFIRNKQVDIGIMGASIGVKYALDPESRRQYPVKTVRDWSLFHFGFISSRQVSLLKDPFSIYPLNPPVLLGYSLSQEEKKRFEKMGYVLRKEIKPVLPRLNLFGGLPDFPIYIFALRVFPSLPQPSNLNLEEQLLVIHFLKKRLRGNNFALRRMGELAKTFYIPNMKNKTIDDEDIELLAIGYLLSRKSDSAMKAFDFLCERWPTPLHLRNREIARKILESQKRDGKR